MFKLFFWTVVITLLIKLIWPSSFTYNLFWWASGVTFVFWLAELISKTSGNSMG